MDWNSGSASSGRQSIPSLASQGPPAEIEALEILDLIQVLPEAEPLQLGLGEILRPQLPQADLLRASGPFDREVGHPPLPAAP
jgi:hypothetical protein